eukprot:UN24314
MKFLQEPHLATLSEALTNIDCGVSVFNCTVEAFSMKPVTEDKKLLKKITRQYSNEQIIDRMNIKNNTLEQMKDRVAKEVKCSLGNLQNLDTQRLMAELIATLNQAHPNSDYSRISPHAFFRASFKNFAQEVESHLSLIYGEPNIVSIFWTSIRKS